MNIQKDQFKKKLYSMTGINNVGIIILCILAIGIFLAGMVLGRTDYNEFSSDSSGYSKIDVKFLMGPFVEKTEDGKTTNEYYLAEDDEYGWFIVGTGVSNMIPVYGVDVYDKDIDGLQSQTIKGNSKEIEYQMIPYLQDFFADAGYDVSELTTDQYVGNYYLDTTDKGNELRIALTVVAGILLLVAIVLWTISLRKIAQIKKGIMILEGIGQFEELYEDFENTSTTPLYSTACKVAVSEHYIMSFCNLDNGILVIPLKNIYNVFRCNMLDGKPTATSYLAVENNNARYYLVAVKERKTKKLDEVVAYMKTKIVREAV